MAGAVETGAECEGQLFGAAGGVRDGGAAQSGPIKLVVEGHGVVLAEGAAVHNEHRVADVEAVEIAAAREQSDLDRHFIKRAESYEPAY